MTRSLLSLSLSLLLLLLAAGCTTPAEDPTTTDDAGADTRPDATPDTDDASTDAVPDAVACAEGVTRWFDCPDGTRVAECMCVNGDDLCIDDAAGQCRSTACDDGVPTSCDFDPAPCGEGELLAAQDGCWVCVNPATCHPWGEAGCATEQDCPAAERCDLCASASCPNCDDCVAACIAHDCPTEAQLTCRCARPDCGQGATSVIRDGCWVCVDVETCADARASGCQ